jgi:Ca-activated chloride channel family protein
MMDRDDPRLTAYALGEADPETVQLVERALRDSEGLREAAADIRLSADLLTKALATEEAPALLPAQRQAIEAEAPSPRGKRVARLAPWAGLAAAVAVAAGASVFFDAGLGPLPEVGEPRLELWLGPADATPPATLAAGRPAVPSPPPGTVRYSEAPALGIAIAPAGLDKLKALGYVGGLLGGVAPQPEEFNTESYSYREDSDFLEVALHPLSTFGADVDTASYANVRRFLNAGQRPPVDAVRIEEMINYFPYAYTPPSGDEAFAAHVEVAPAPWKRAHRLVRIALKAREIATEDRPPSNLVFLVDVSGSMDEPHKLPLVQRSLKMLVRRLDGRDRVALVVYAGQAGLVLPSTPGDQRHVLLEAIDRLRAGGSTNGGQGIHLAYDVATRALIRGGVNRVVLATDGDFNVGVTDEGSLVRLVQEKARRGVFLSVLGFGMGNLQDARLETLADKGNGNYAYVDTDNEARKALVEQMMSTLVTVAKDVKIQAEFNPAEVAAYRLLGYENRALAPEDFKDDRKDAGEVGAGHAVTVLYEVVPVGTPLPRPRTDPLTYRREGRTGEAASSGELLRLKVRYKEPESETSQALEWPVSARPVALDESSADFRFAAAVAEFGLVLRASPHKAGSSLDSALELAEGSVGDDPSGYRAEFVELVKGARRILARE